MVEERDSEEIKRLFLEFMHQRDPARSMDVDSLCRRYPEEAEAIRKLGAHWAHLQGLFGNLAQSASFSDLLEKLYGRGSEHLVTLRGHEEESADLANDLIHRLSTRGPGYARYRIKGEIARGGQGAVVRIWDEDLRRNLAMKIMLGQSAEDGSPPVDTKTLGRFLEEAQITGQLDHPGIVPVHELGLDADGRVYFTMKLVRGQSLAQILAKEAADWSLQKKLGVLLKVCEAMSYAHSKDVVHRDLKPSNLMLGSFGEVYVMDWGLARLVTHGTEREERPSNREASSDIHPLGRAEDPTSPLRTQEGDVVGTPSYMAPEQAKGHVDLVGPHSDVYSVGAILYELLSGFAPYGDRESRPSVRTVLRWIVDGPPTDLDLLCPHAPPEAVSICRQAMERRIDRRFRDMQAMGEELRAYLEGRVVPSYKTGLFIELRKWAGRNRATAASLVALLAVILLSGFAMAWSERRRAHEIRQRSDLGLALDLLGRVEGPGPIASDYLGARLAWLEEAEALRASSDAYFVELVRLRRDAEPIDDDQRRREREGHPSWSELQTLEALIEDGTALLADRRALVASPAIDEGERRRASLDVLALERALDRRRRRADSIRRTIESRRTWRFQTSAQQRDHDSLERLVLALEELTLPDEGAIVRVQREVAATRTLEELAGRHQQRWERAIEEVADRSVCPLYEGLLLRPQSGLVPIGRDPTSGLWEFWHVLSGQEPQQGPDGIEMGWDTGIVLVLLPGGGFYLGSQAEAREEPNFDPASQVSEQPLTWIELEPFFVSKYELTQRQWLTLTGSNPSEWFAGSDWAGYGTIHEDHPVERVSWTDCVSTLTRYGLSLPTETQWEYAARAGTDTPYWFGRDFRSGSSWVNHGDRSAAAVGILAASGSLGRDEYPLHAPVHAFPPNPFGLHGVLGNVVEWCRDWYADDYETVQVSEGRAELLSRFRRYRAVRGGSFKRGPAELRVSRRRFEAPDVRSDEIGVRAVRDLEVN